MNALVIRLPFATPEETELPGRAPYQVTQRSRIGDEEREAALDRAVAEATTPAELAAAWDAIDAYEEERHRDAEEEANQMSQEEELR